MFQIFRRRAAVEAINYYTVVPTILTAYSYKYTRHGHAYESCLLDGGGVKKPLATGAQEDWQVGAPVVWI